MELEDNIAYNDILGVFPLGEEIDSEIFAYLIKWFENHEGFVSYFFMAYIHTYCVFIYI